MIRAMLVVLVFLCVVGCAAPLSYGDAVIVHKATVARLRHIHGETPETMDPLHRNRYDMQASLVRWRRATGADETPNPARDAFGAAFESLDTALSGIEAWRGVCAFAAGDRG